MELDQDTVTQDLHAKWERSFAAEQQRWEEQLRSSIVQVTEDIRMEMYVSWTALVEEAVQTLKDSLSGLNKSGACSALGSPDVRHNRLMNPEEEQPPYPKQQQQQQQQQRLPAPRSFEECLLATRRQSQQLSSFFLDVLEHRPCPHCKRQSEGGSVQREPSVTDACSECPGGTPPPTEERLTTIKSKLQELRKNLTDRSPNRSPSRASSLGRRVPPLPGTAKESSAAGVSYPPSTAPRSVDSSPERKDSCPPMCIGTPGTTMDQPVQFQSPKPSTRTEVAFLPQSPVPGARSPPAVAKAISASDLQHVTWASRRTSHCILPSWVPPVTPAPDVASHSTSCIPQDGVEKVAALSPAPSPGTSVKTRPSSTRTSNHGTPSMSLTPGASVQVRSAQPPGQVSSTSGPRQIQEKGHHEQPSHLQGPAWATVCPSLQKAPPLWRTQPNQTAQVSQVSQISPTHMQSVIRTPGPLIMMPVSTASRSSRPASLGKHGSPRGSQHFGRSVAVAAAEAQPVLSPRAKTIQVNLPVPSESTGPLSSGDIGSMCTPPMHH
mmetsp:Transcript_109499/g.217451  ORF Transcript_109499/g.217451 Transcript_109499/m.217451 type:complete len:549 (-) Transcript_109499:42-1688(-)